MSSLPNISLQFHLELSFLPSACITLHTSLLQGFPVTLANCDDTLLQLDPASFFIEYPMDIRLYRASRTYQTASRARTIPSFSIALTVPSADDLTCRAIYHYDSSFLLNLQLKSYWTSPSGNIHESYYPNQISNLFLEKCCLQCKKSLILRCQHRLLRLPSLLAPSSSTTLVNAYSHSSNDFLCDKSNMPLISPTSLSSPLSFLPVTIKPDPSCPSWFGLFLISLDKRVDVTSSKMRVSLS